MQKVSWFFKISAVAILAFIVATASLASGFSSNALAATGTAAAGAKQPFETCKAPTPVPTATNTKVPPTKVGGTKVATAAATMAATMEMTMAATMAPTMAATMAATMAMTMAPTMAATMVATATVAPPPTLVPTTIPTGKKPASAGVVVRFNAKLLRGGKPCVVVFATTAGGPSDIAGIKKDDLILGFDKEAVKDAADFYAQVEKHVSGDKVLITVQRGTDEIAFLMTLGLNPFADANATAAATAAATKAK